MLINLMWSPSYNKTTNGNYIWVSEDNFKQHLPVSHTSVDIYSVLQNGCTNVTYTPLIPVVCFLDC